MYDFGGIYSTLLPLAFGWLWIKKASFKFKTYMNSFYCVVNFDLLKADGALKLYVLVDHKYHSLDITARCISSDWLSLKLKINGIVKTCKGLEMWK